MYVCVCVCVCVCVYIYIYIYRVSIKSFPHYKPLLQENYMAYKLFFFKM